MERDLENELARSRVPFDRSRIVRDWNTILVNPWNPLPEGFQADLADTIDGYKLDSRAVSDFEAMMEKMRSYDLKPQLISAYRSVDLQTELFTNEVRTLTQAGMPEETATREAARSTAKPGTSEHHTGLAVDIVASHHQNLDDSQADTGVAKWLKKYAYKYGFILRYPEGRESTTGIIFEPWHYRYVGKDVAIVIHDNDLTLEDYLKEELV